MQNKNPAHILNNFHNFFFYFLFCLVCFWVILLKKTVWPFLWMGCSCPKVTKPLWEDSLLFTSQFPEFPVELGRKKAELNLELPSDFEPRTPDWESSALTTRPLFHINWMYHQSLLRGVILETQFSRHFL